MNNNLPRPLPGEVWLVASRTPGVSPGMVVIMDAGRRHLSVLVADNDLDAATSRDLCFAAGVATPWTLRVCGDLVGPIRRTAFLRRVGALPPPVSADLRVLGYLGETDEMGDASRAHISGLPLRGLSDPRWTWLEERAPCGDRVVRASLRHRRT